MQEEKESETERQLIKFLVKMINRMKYEATEQAISFSALWDQTSLQDQQLALTHCQLLICLLTNKNTKSPVQLALVSFQKRTRVFSLTTGAYCVWISTVDICGV